MSAKPTHHLAAKEQCIASRVRSQRHSGTAWDVWLAKLRGELETADEKACGEAMMGNSWIYGTLVEYRTHAARYLRSIAGMFR